LSQNGNNSLEFDFAKVGCSDCEKIAAGLALFSSRGLRLDQQIFFDIPIGT